MRNLKLKEYKPRTGVELSVEERDFLRENKIDVSPTQGAQGRYDLRPGSWIGALSIGSPSGQYPTQDSTRQGDVFDFLCAGSF